MKQRTYAPTTRKLPRLNNICKCGFRTNETIVKLNKNLCPKCGRENCFEHIM